MTRCPQCLFETLRPDLVTTGNHLQCIRCGCVVVPGSQLRRECTTCGRKKCPWGRYGPAHCGRWRPIHRAEIWRDTEMFEEVA